MNRLFNPTTIAVIGGTEAERVIAQCDRLGFDGEIWPVHPTRQEMAGRAVFKSVDALPGVPDAAFVAVPRKETIEVVRQLSALGAGGAVCYASGFAEVGESDLESALLTAAGDMPILGPNCYGFINATSGAALWPDEHGLSRVELGAAIISQSGNMSLNFTLQDRGLPLTHVFSLGNQAAVGFEDAMMGLLDDSRVEAIGLHIEGIRDAQAFGRAAIRAAAQQVPIVALKTGVSKQGAGIAQSHTASLAGNDAAVDALFQRYGVYRTHTIPEFLEVMKLLSVTGPIDGRRLISLSCSGGEASLVADRSEHYDISFPELDPDHAADIAHHLDDLVTVSNPLDYHTFQWGDGKALAETFTTALSGQFDAAILIIDFPNRAHNDDTLWWPTLDGFVSAAERTGTPAVVTSSLPETMPAAVRDHLVSRGIAPMTGIDETLSALAAAAAFGRRLRSGPPTLHAAAPPTEGEGRLLTEWRSKQLLADAGVLIPDGYETDDPIKAAELLGYPVAVKVTATAHKSDVGGVLLDLNSPTDVASAVASMPASDKYLVELMVAGGVAEVIVGVRRHPGLGWLLTIGGGGEMTEMLHDTVNLILPVTPERIEAALLNLSTGRLFSGFRGRPVIDVSPAVEAISAICQFALEHPEVETAEVNPLVVTAEAAIAVDALVIVSEKQPEQ